MLVDETRESTDLQHRDQLLFGDADAISITAVDDVDDGVCVGVVAAPVRPNGRLAAEIPHLKLQVLVRHLLHVEADGW